MKPKKLNLEKIEEVQKKRRLKKLKLKEKKLKERQVFCFDCRTEISFFGGRKRKKQFRQQYGVLPRKSRKTCGKKG